jgi:hypothetical protein
MIRQRSPKSTVYGKLSQDVLTQILADDHEAIENYDAQARLRAEDRRVAEEERRGIQGEGLPPEADEFGFGGPPERPDATREAPPAETERINRELTSEDGAVRIGVLLPISQEMATKVHDTFWSFVDTLRTTPEQLAEQELRARFVGRRNSPIAEANQLRLKLQNDQKKAGPRPKDNPLLEQEALYHFREFQNRPGEIARALNGTHPWYDEYEEWYAQNVSMDPAKITDARAEALSRIQAIRPILEMAQNPTEWMRNASGQLTSIFQKLLREGQRLKFLDSRIGASEYITHILTNDEHVLPPGPGEAQQTNVGGGAMPMSLTFAKKRTFETLVKAMIFGKEPATMNALDVLSTYAMRHAKTAATKEFQTFLKDSDQLKFGMRGSKNIPNDWIPFSKAGDPLWKFPVRDSEGNITGEVMAYGPPKIVEALRPITDPDFFKLMTGKFGRSIEAFRHYQAYLKCVQLGLSAFHMRALTLTGFANMGPINTIKALKADMYTPRFEDMEREMVGQTGTTDILMGSERRHGKLRSALGPLTTIEKINRLPVIKQIAQAADTLTGTTFGVVQRKLKVYDYALQKARWIAKHPGYTEAELKFAQREICKEVNAAYGGLNWETMGITKSGVALSRMIFLAPDWTFSNLAMAKYAFQGGPAGQAARAFWARGALVGVALNEGMSLLLTGEFSDDPSQVYLGKDKDGHKHYASWFFAGAHSDWINLVKNCIDFQATGGVTQSISNKLAAMPRFAGRLLGRRTYTGQPLFPKGMPPGSTEARMAVYAATQMGPVPFTMANPLEMYFGPEHYTVPEYIGTILFGGRIRSVAPSGTRTVRSGPKAGQIVPVPKKMQTTWWQAVKTGKAAIPNVAHLPLDKAIENWDIANDDQRRQMYRAILKKSVQISKYPEARRDELRRKMDEVRAFRDQIEATGPPPGQEALPVAPSRRNW